MPGERITDQQVRLYMTLRRTHTQRVAAAKAGFSERSGRRTERDPRLPSDKAAARAQAAAPDPLGTGVNRRRNGTPDRRAIGTSRPHANKG